ncbi:MAG: methyltransferase domain-containing protein [Ruminococcaceae bacterium]|nr:methyltransferase domain-containing protein [Oscillospiraceae bacterium]
MSGYGCFSKYYDILNQDIDYKGRAEYLRGLFKRLDREPTLLLDLACGTGGFSSEFSKMGLDVIGVDPSEDMLGIARNKEYGQKAPLYLCQSGQELDLFGTVDGAVCCLDSINHITDEADLFETFKKVSLFLEPERLFIFDVNTEYKHKSVLADNTFVRETEDMFFVWQNSYDECEKITDIYLDFFIKNGDNYIRESEDFSERVYSDECLRELLRKSGFEVLAVYDDMSQSEPNPESERIIYVAKKVN